MAHIRAHILVVGLAALWPALARADLGTWPAEAAPARIVDRAPGYAATRTQAVALDRGAGDSGLAWSRLAELPPSAARLPAGAPVLLSNEPDARVLLAWALGSLGAWQFTRSSWRKLDLRALDDDTFTMECSHPGAYMPACVPPIVAPAPGALRERAVVHTRNHLSRRGGISSAPRAPPARGSASVAFVNGFLT
jgi:hypothetical protein